MTKLSEFEYSYTILKYRHDIAAGEALNVGVVLYCPAKGQVGFVFDQKYRRLSSAFAGFDGDQHRKMLRRLEDALNSLARPLANSLFEIEERSRYPDAGAVIRTVWPDQGLSYFAGLPLFGIAEDLEAELKDLYDRFVLSQADARPTQERYDDHQLWEKVKAVLTPRGIAQMLVPVTLGPVEVEFEHAYKNGKWHAIETISMDYLEGNEMKKRAFEMVGKVSSVGSLPEMGTCTIVVGAPRRREAEKGYAEARRILMDAPGGPRIVLESEIESLAEDIEREMRQYGMLA